VAPNQHQYFIHQTPNLQNFLNPKSLHPLRLVISEPFLCRKNASKFDLLKLLHQFWFSLFLIKIPREV